MATTLSQSPAYDHSFDKDIPNTVVDCLISNEEPEYDEQDHYMDSDYPYPPPIILEFNFESFAVFNPVPHFGTEQIPLFNSELKTPPLTFLNEPSDSPEEQTITNPDNNDAGAQGIALYEGVLTNFFKDIIAAFKIEKDISFEFPQLNLSLSESSIHAHNVSLSRLQQLLDASNQVDNPEPLKIVILEGPSSFEKQIAYLESFLVSESSEYQEEYEELGPVAANSDVTTGLYDAEHSSFQGAKKVDDFVDPPLEVSDFAPIDPAASLHCPIPADLVEQENTLLNESSILLENAEATDELLAPPEALDNICDMQESIIDESAYALVVEAVLSEEPVAMDARNNVASSDHLDEVVELSGPSTVHDADTIGKDDSNIVFATLDVISSTDIVATDTALENYDSEAVNGIGHFESYIEDHIIEEGYASENVDTLLDPQHFTRPAQDELGAEEETGFFEEQLEYRDELSQEYEDTISNYPADTVVDEEYPNEMEYGQCPEVVLGLPGDSLDAISAMKQRKEDVFVDMVQHRKGEIEGDALVDMKRKCEMEQDMEPTGICFLLINGSKQDDDQELLPYYSYRKISFFLKIILRNPSETPANVTQNPFPMSRKVIWHKAKEGLYAVSLCPLKKGSTTKLMGYATSMNDFASMTAEPAFERRLHATLAKHVHSDPTWQAHAKHQKVGFLSIGDERIFTMFGRVPDPEDILGTVLLDKGSIVEGSYERFPTHRLGSLNGIFQLSEFLQLKFDESLEKDDDSGRVSSSVGGTAIV